MIVNKNDFHCFLKKVNNGLGNFNEVIVPYRARSDDENTAFHFQRFEENIIPNLNFFGTIYPTKILFYLPSQKVYLLKNHCAKRIMLGIINDTKKSMESFFRNNIKRVSKIIIEFLLTLVKMNY